MGGDCHTNVLADLVDCDPFDRLGDCVCVVVAFVGKRPDSGADEKRD